MTPAVRAVLRGALIAAGIAVAAAGALQLRLADWPVYLVYVLLSAALFAPYVEVLPLVTVPIPELAATIGFLYIGGPPIIVLHNLVPALTRFVRRLLPEDWKKRTPLDAEVARRELFAGWGSDARVNAAIVAEWAFYTVGLGVRCWIVSALIGAAPATAHPGAMAVAEAGGYACWWLFAMLPIYPDRPLLGSASEGERRAALSDVGLIVVLALTPFVFLIAYGFRTAGLAGAAASSLSALGLHFMLKRLNERRLIVEEQNRRLATLNRELEHRERLSAIGKMSSVVSHQILHQLGVIGIYADLIRNAADEGDPATALAQARKNTVAIEGALRDVNRVLTDLLVFSKDLRLNLYEHPLPRLIDECIEDCRAEARERGVALRTECPAALDVTVDKLKMKQVLVNILRNAIDASSPGSEVVVHAVVRGGGAEVAVSDSGVGIPERDREAVFTPFFTTKEHGTGLGLAIARQFTEAHGGRLWVEGHTNGPGATFVVRLPLAGA